VSVGAKAGFAQRSWPQPQPPNGFRNEENQFAFYEAMEKFFAQHLKP
jgi:hypothetical protein